MRVLITGATGFIGSHIADLLCKRGYQITCSVRKTSNLTWLENLPVEYLYGDLFDRKMLESAVEGVDYVYHVAGITKARTKEEYFRGNHEATRNLLRAVLTVNPGLKRFVHVSSQAAVGPSANGTPINEETPFHPITTYGLSKMEAEKECLRVMEKLPITITRPPAVYGPRDKDVFTFFETMNRGLQPMIGFHDKYVSLIHVLDLANGIILAGEHESSVGKSYFIASERYYNWKEIGEITARVMNKKAFRLRIPEAGVYTIAGVAEMYSLLTKKAVVLNLEKARDIVQRSWTCDITKAKTELGFREFFSLEEGIRNTVEWYREKGWLK